MSAFPPGAGRRWSASLLTVGVLALTSISASPASADSPDPGARSAASRAPVVQRTPKTALRAPAPGVPMATNPVLSLLEDPSRSNWYGWTRQMQAQAGKRAALKKRRAVGAGPAGPLRVSERQAAVRGANDTFATAQSISLFGTGRGHRSSARITGRLAPVAPRPFTPRREDNGSIRQASPTGLVSGQFRTATATIGNGPHGSRGDGSGDFDFYAVPGLKAGDRLTMGVDTPDSDLDTMVVLFAGDGRELASNDDDGAGTDSFLALSVPETGDYYVMVTGYPVLPDSPFDSGSGNGADQEGSYRITLGLNAGDVDYYAVTLRRGDIVSGAISGAGRRLEVYDSRRREVFAATVNRSALYPAVSPLGGEGRAAVDHVVRKTGRYYIAARHGEGSYEIDLHVHRTPTRNRYTKQTFFLDFDGQRLDTSIFGGSGEVSLSALPTFLDDWGIPAGQADAVIDRVIATVDENLRRDFAGTGVRVKLRNSRDHQDRFGQPGVSRAIIGGTVDEAMLETIGISESVDPGNFDTTETALVLLDRLSAPGKRGRRSASLNDYLPSSAPTSQRVRFVGTALGNVVSHELGHLLGNWHLDPGDAVADLMDAGGNAPQLFGVGPDGQGATSDDVDVDFGSDLLNWREGMFGTESSRTRVRWGLLR